MPARTPEDVDRLFGEYANAGDLDALADLYEDSATLVQPEGAVAEGRPAIRAALARLLEARPTIQMHVVRVVRGGDDVAVLYNDWRASGRNAQGRVVEMASKAMEIVRRQPDGTWRFVIDDPYARS